MAMFILIVDNITNFTVSLFVVDDGCSLAEAVIAAGADFTGLTSSVVISSEIYKSVIIV